jgi:hypothetical protein
MPRRIGVEMAGSASGANMMDVFADKEKKDVPSGSRRDYWPYTAVIQTFGQNCKERYAQQCSSCEADQRAKSFVFQPQ